MPEIKNDTVLQKHVIRTLLYYDIFNYPLKATEVFRFLSMNSISEPDVVSALDTLAAENRLSKFGEYFLVQNSKALVERRIKGNAEATKYIPLARQQAHFISRFPFVRSVFASGSLSKDYMDDGCDLDFFIVTAPKRLWISRTLLVLYKRIFLKNSHRQFCVNYFIDTAHLEIEEKNLFTATELATVIPLHGGEYYPQLLSKNQEWLLRFFPNFKPRRNDHVPVNEPSILKRFVEGVFNLFFGSMLNKLLMSLTLRRWKTLYRDKYELRDFQIAFKTKEYASKNHPRNFQKMVMERYRQKLEAFSEQFNLDCRL